MRISDWSSDVCSSDLADLQHWLDRRKPGQSRFTTQRREPDTVKILSGVFEGETTGTPVSLVIENEDQRSKDYGDIADKFRPGHADYRSEGHTSELQSLLRISYAVFCLKKKKLRRTTRQDTIQ